MSLGIIKNGEYKMTAANYEVKEASKEIRQFNRLVTFSHIATGVDSIVDVSAEPGLYIFQLGAGLEEGGQGGAFKNYNYSVVQALSSSTVLSSMTLSAGWKHVVQAYASWPPTTFQAPSGTSTLRIIFRIGTTGEGYANGDVYIRRIA